jgi:outer membrane protein assembly complex protein YaeT
LKRVKRVAIVFGTLVAIAILIIAGLLRSGVLEERLRRRLQERSAKATGAEVSIARLELSLLPPSVSLREISVRRRGNRGSSAEVSIPKLKVRAGALTFLGLRRGPVELAIENPVASLELAAGRPVLAVGVAAPDLPGLLAMPPPGSSARMTGGTITLVTADGARCRLEGVSASIRPGAAPAHLVGRVEVSGGDAHLLDADWKDLGAEAELELSPDHLKVDPLSLRAEGVAISGRMQVALDKGWEAEGELRVGGDTAGLFGRFLPAEAHPAGRVEARLQGRWGGEGLDARGEASAMSLRLFGVQMDSLRADLSLDAKGFSATAIKANLMGGEATGSVAVALAEPTRPARIDARVDGVDLAQVLARAGWSGPAVRGTVHYRGEHTLDSGGAASLGGSGLFDAVGHYESPRGGDRPLEVTSSLELQGTTIRLSGGTLRVGSVRGGFSGSVTPGEGIRLKLKGATGDISELLPLFSATASPPPGKAAAAAPRSPAPKASPAPAPTPTSRPTPVRVVSFRPAAGDDSGGGSALERLTRALGGRWEWDGDLSYGRGPLAFEGRLAGSDLTLGGTALGSIEAQVLYRGDRLSIRQGSFRPAGGGEVRMSGSVDFGERGTVSVEASAADCPIATLLALAGRPLPIEGRVSGTIGLGGRPLSPAGHAVVRSGPVLIAGLEFDSMQGEIVFTPDLLDIQSFSLSRGSGQLRFEGRLPYGGTQPGGGVDAGARPLTLKVSGEDLDLSGWFQVRPGSRPPLGGKASIAGSIAGSLAAPSGALGLKVDNLELMSAPLGALAIEASLTGEKIDLKGELPESHATVEGSVGLEAGGPADLRVILTKAEMQSQIVLGALEKVGVVASGLVEIHGPILDWRRLGARLTLSDLSIDVAGVGARAGGPVEAKLEEGRMVLTPFSLVGEGTSIEIAGSVEPGQDGAIDLSARGRFDLLLLKAFLKNLQATGRGEVEVRATGSRSRPEFRGALDLTAGAIRYPDLPFPINNLEAHATFDAERVRFESLRMQAGGGPMEGTAEVLLGGGSGLALTIQRAELDVKGRDVKSEFPEGFQSASDLDLHLRVDPAGALLRGTVDLVRGVYGREFRVSSTTLSGGFGSLTGSRTSPIAGLRLDLAVRAPGEVWLRNDFGSLEAEGELHVTGMAGRPVVAGRVSVREGGTIRFRGVRYRVDHGTFDFADPDRINPAADVVATTTVGEYQVSLHVEGTVDSFKYDLSSNPPLPSQDIVALLLTGRAPTPQAAGTRLLGEETVSAYLTGRIGEELSEKIGGRSGLDLITIDPLSVNGQGDPSARLTIGKQVTPDLFVTYSSDLGTTKGAIYQLDYALTRDLKLTSVRDEDGSIGGDFRYVFRGRPPSLPALTSVGPSMPERPRIGTVRLEGTPGLKASRVLRRLRLRPGRRRDRAAVGDGIERAIAFYRRHGFLMAEVDVREEASGPARVDLTVRVKSGPRVEIEFAGVRGREGMRQKIAPYWEKGLFLEDIVADARDRVRTLYEDRGYLSAQVDARVLESTDERTRVLFEVKRGPRVRAAEVRIAGASLLPEAEVRKVIRTRRDGLFSRGIVKGSRLRDDAESIRALYLKRGFPHVHVPEPETILDPRGGKGAKVVFTIEEGPRMRLHAVRFEGAGAIPAARLAESAGLKAGVPFAAEAADAAVLRVRRAYDDAGFYDVRVESRIESLSRDGGDEQADLVIKVEAGTQARVGQIDISGNLITRQDAIRKALTVKPGDPLSRGDLLESQKRLYQRGIFTSVSVQPGAATEAAGQEPPEPPVPRDVAVSVREAAPLTQVFGLGYNSEEKGRAQYEIANRNILGSGRYLGLQTRASDLKRSASVLYRERGIFGGNFDAQASAFDENERRTGFDVRTIGSSVQIGRQSSRATRVLYRYTLKDVDLSNASADFEGTTLRLASLATSAVHDTRDSLFEPLRGHYVGGELQYFGSAVGSEADFVKLSAQALSFREILPRTVWAQAVRAGIAPTFGRSRRDPASTGDEVSGLPPSERFFAGGDTTVRGFRRDHVGPLDANGDPLGGEGVFILNEELRVPIFRGLQGVVFYDAGNVFRRVGDYDITDLRHVAGAGLRVGTPIGPFRIEYGALLDRRQGEAPGEFFISIGQAF